MRPLIGWLLLTPFILVGCATGRTEFKVVKAEPTPAGEALEPVATPTPAVGEASGTTSLAPAEPKAYIVQEGDSLWRICRRLLGDPLLYPEVARLNHLHNPDLIHPQQTLILPKGANLAIPSVPVEENSSAQAVAAPAQENITARTVAKPAAPVQGNTSAQAVTKTAGAAVVYPARPNHAFGPGEKLLFSVEYFGISAGFATLTVENGPKTNDRPTLRLVATARTHPAFEWFFVVRDRIESVFDGQGLFPWRYEKHLREGGYSNDSYMIYDQPNRKVIKDEGRTTIDAAEWVQDVVSEFYFYRSLHITQLGQTTAFPVVADDGKCYEVVVKTLRRETVQVPAGKFSCIVVEPQIKFEGLFQQKGKMEIWLTDDQRQVPVLIKSAIVIGTIDIVLRDAEVVDM